MASVSLPKIATRYTSRGNALSILNRRFHCEKYPSITCSNWQRALLQGHAVIGHELTTPTGAPAMTRQINHFLGTCNNNRWISTGYQARREVRQNRWFFSSCSSLANGGNRPGVEGTQVNRPLDAAPSSPHVDVGAVAERLGLRLTSCERSLLQNRLDFDQDGKVTDQDFVSASRRATKERAMRELCLEVIEQPTTPAATLATRFLHLMNYVGTALFSVVGTQVAGDAGFNLVGCALVGCVAGLGGRSIHNLFYGSSSPLWKRLPGVFWARNPSYLAVAIVSSVVTFFVWPVYCHQMSVYYLENIIGRDNLEEDGTLGEKAFVDACRRDEHFLETVQLGLSSAKKIKNVASLHPTELFRLILATSKNYNEHNDNSRSIQPDQLTTFVQERFRNSWEMYAIDTAALASLSVAGVHGAISMGLHPLVAATSGITMSLGGILRDIFCGRDLAVASQSYAFATGAGSAVYVLMRELALRGFPVMAITRIVLSMGTTVSLRYWEFVKGESLLAPMHGRPLH